MCLNKYFIFFGLPVILFSQDSTQIDMPQKIGPIIDTLPILDSLIVVKKDSVKQKESINKLINRYPNQ